MDDQTQQLRQGLKLQRNEHISKVRQELGQRQLVLRDQNGAEMEAYRSQYRFFHLDQPADPLVREMPTGSGAPEPPAQPVPARKLSQYDKKKREKLAAQADKAMQDLQTKEETLTEGRRWALTHTKFREKSDFQREETVLDARLKAITAGEQLSLKDAKLSRSQRADRAQTILENEIRWKAQDARAKAIGSYARLLPLDSKERRKAMEEKERQELQANKLRKAFRVSSIRGDEERKREEDTISRHGHYDRLKAIFRRDNPLSHEDAGCTDPVSGHALVNVGRAFMGGTKAMYIFEDKQGGNAQYLFKEATNCIGIRKPAGAMVTAAAAGLQKALLGDRSIPAFALRDKNGDVLGSMQQRVEVKDHDPGVDLFSWQAQTDPPDVIEPEEKAQILQDHTLDWLLCNFDTKGENFLRRKDGKLVSFDKEASFNQIYNPEAQSMSYSFKPHSADTLYNVMFRQYAAGKLTLDLRGVEEQIKKVESMEDREYLGFFQEMLTQKFSSGRIKHDKQRREMEAAILERKARLRERYTDFFTKLVQERSQALRDAGKDDDAARLLDAQGRFSFGG